MKFWMTTFADVYANSLQGEDFSLDELADLIRNTAAPAKETLPLLKLARFGVLRTAAGALRHDANVVTVSGIEGDYDGESMPFEEAVSRLEAAGLAFIAYTSPSHTPAKPRWRIVAPFSKELAPGERARMLNRLNGVLGGVLSAESWAVSQSYFFGSVNGAAAAIHLGDDEEPIDERDDLDATAQPYRPAAGTAGPGGKPDLDKLDEHELLELIQTGQVYYGAAKRLLAMWAQQGIAEADAQSNLESAFAVVPIPQRDKKWNKRRGNIARWVKDAYARAAKKRGYLRALVAHLEETLHWRGAIRLNRLTQAIEVCDPFPPQPGQTAHRHRPLHDPADILRMLMHIQESGFPRATKETIRDAVTLVADDHAYHPIGDWLSGLVWDGEARLHRLFIDYFPGELPEDDKSWAPLRPAGELSPRDKLAVYFEKTAECFMVGAVARVFKPGEKVDTLPVLIGPEGYNKSLGIQALVPDPTWFSDDLSTNLIDRDTKDSLTGKWLIELSEFPHARRDVEKVKAFFSRQTDRFRRAYDRLPRDWPRPCVFVGTANELEFISATGNRRFWPIPIARAVNITAITQDRDQLWAEAVDL